MHGRRKPSRSQRYSWIIRRRHWHGEFIPDIPGGSVKGKMQYKEPVGEWEPFQPGNIIWKLVVYNHLSYAANVKRRLHHPLDIALEIAFKAQEILHMYGLDFEVYNVKTKEEIPVCSL